MKKLIIYYNFILVTIMVIGGFISSDSIPQLVSSIVFYPLFAYLFLLVIPVSKKSLKQVVSPQRIISPQHDAESIASIEDLKEIINEEFSVESKNFKKGIDIDRRAFLKIIGSAGVSLFLFTMFTKKAEAAFFGSVPGPGTVAVKNISGVAIDPAEKHPTDGFEITQIDDASPSYYGYLNKTGAWFITREDETGGYRYTKGETDFVTNWTNRASLSYDYFDNTF